MPQRSGLQRILLPVVTRTGQLQRAALGALDVAYQIALLPFRRAAPRGNADASADLVARTDAFNAAAEDYFAGYRDREFLLNKPFSEPDAFGKHLIDAGTLVRGLRLVPGDVVLEIGAGTGWLSHLLNRFGCHTIALDVSPTAVALAQQLFERETATNWSLVPRFLTYDGHRLPLDDASCDRIVINDAFHHLPNQRELLREMYRVLRRGGMVAMSEPGREHAASEHSRDEAAGGVLENELMVEHVAALAQQCGFATATVIAASPHLQHEVDAGELGAFMGGRGFAPFWKQFTGALERHHYVLLYRDRFEHTTKRPGTIAADIGVLGLMRRGDRTLVTIRLRNTGDSRWLSDEAAGRGWTRVGVHLYSAGDPPRLVDADWHRQELPRDVAPGDSVTMELALPALPAGRYVGQIDLVAEGLFWFADRGSRRAVVEWTVEH